MGARNVNQLADDLAAVELDGYPYGALDAAQRTRSMDGGNATSKLSQEGSAATLGGPARRGDRAKIAGSV